MAETGIVHTDKLPETAGDIIDSGRTLRQIQTQYMTAVAVQKPRDLMEVEKKCLIEAALAGEACFYGWGNGKDRVEGPSIVLAMIAVRNWGNCAIETPEPIETPNAYVFRASFIDLETGFTYTRPFRQAKKWTVYGKMDEYRKDDVRFQIGASKAQRNAVLRCLPGWLVDKMMDKAKAGVKEELQAYIDKHGIAKAREKALDGITKFGVSKERVEAKYEKKLEAWDIDVLVLLAGDRRALTDKAESAEVLFPDPNIKVDPETGEILDSGKKNEGLDTSAMTAGDEKKHQGFGKPDPAKKPEENKGKIKAGDPGLDF